MQPSVGWMPSEQLSTSLLCLSNVAQLGACAHTCVLGATCNINETLRLPLSCGKYHITVALLVFTVAVFKMWSFFLGHLYNKMHNMTNCVTKQFWQENSTQDYTNYILLFVLINIFQLYLHYKVFTMVHPLQKSSHNSILSKVD
jgi:hypothetical protein